MTSPFAQLLALPPELLDVLRAEGPGPGIVLNGPLPLYLEHDTRPAMTRPKARRYLRRGFEAQIATMARAERAADRRAERLSFALPLNWTEEAQAAVERAEVAYELAQRRVAEACDEFERRFGRG
jgi:hypothetical protein